MKKVLKRLISSAMVFVLAIITFVPTLAYGWVTSAHAYANVGAYEYTYNSIIEQWSMSLNAVTSVTANSSVPTGYMGVQARMFSANGALVASSSWAYNNSAKSGYETGVSYSGIPNEYYFSRGLVRFYNGNGYTAYAANATPNVVMPLGRSVIFVNTNAKGEVYGSDLFLSAAGISADLIYAIGENGIEGYVKAVDLDGEVPENPYEAVQLEQNTKIIPLYESDGETIIGSFKIQNGDNT